MVGVDGGPAAIVPTPLLVSSRFRMGAPSVATFHASPSLGTPPTRQSRARVRRRSESDGGSVVGGLDERLSSEGDSGKSASEASWLVGGRPRDVSWDADTDPAAGTMWTVNGSVVPGGSGSPDIGYRNVNPSEYSMASSSGSWFSDRCVGVVSG